MCFLPYMLLNFLISTCENRSKRKKERLNCVFKLLQIFKRYRLMICSQTIILLDK